MIHPHRNADGSFDLRAPDGMAFGSPSFTSRREAQTYLDDFGREIAELAASWVKPSHTRICGGRKP